MPDENFNELENQPQGQPNQELDNQLDQEPQTPELDPFERVLQELPEDKRKIVEEHSMRHKAFTQKTQKLSKREKEIEQFLSENKNKVEFYNRFRDDDNFRQEVLSSLGATKKVQKSDDFEEQYAKAQELINELEPNARRAMGFLIKKQIRDELGPLQNKISEFERQQTERQQRKNQQLNQERQQVLLKFKARHSEDYDEVEPEMERIVKKFPGFFNQSPQDLDEALEAVYVQANLPKYKQKAEEKGIKKMLDQNIQAQKIASKTVSKPSPRKTFNNDNKKLTLDEAFDKVWDEYVGG